MKTSHLADRPTTRTSVRAFLNRCGPLFGVGAVVVGLLVCGCAETKGVKSANLNQKLPEPDAEFMKRVERDPFPTAQSVSATAAGSRTKSNESKR